MRSFATFAILLVGCAAVADEVTWTPPRQIRAVVVDRDPRPVAGVAVAVRQMDAGKAAESLISITDPNGIVSFQKLPAGSYVITFRLSGFAETSLGPVPVQDTISKSPRIPDFRVMLNPVLF